MKHFKRAFVALTLAGTFSFGAPAFAYLDALYGSEQWARTYLANVRPMVAKMPMADKMKVMDMEMAITRMEANHSMTMMKMSVDHKMAIAKMRRELEEFIVGKGAF